MRFRELEASEIECRVGTVSKVGKGLTLLLYKTARCDADILDEEIGPENWQCEFYECKGTLFCRVGIRCGGGSKLDGAGIELSPVTWAWKSDAGAPSNMEAQKGEASDAFKRACFKWGIGRELYTAPFIWIPNDKCNIVDDRGKWTCRDTFSVAKIAIAEDEHGRRRISGIRIMNDKTKRVAFSWKED